MTLAPGPVPVETWVDRYRKRECNCSICMDSKGAGHREHTLKPGCWCASKDRQKCTVTVLYPGVEPDNGEGAGLPRREGTSADTSH